MPKRRTNPLTAVGDRGKDLLDKARTPASRAGQVVARVTSLRADQVDRDVIALQMTKTSPTGQRYTPEMVDAIEALGRDSITGVALTAAQTRALSNDQKRYGTGCTPSFASRPWIAPESRVLPSSRDIELNWSSVYSTASIASDRLLIGTEYRARTMTAQAEQSGPDRAAPSRAGPVFTRLVQRPQPEHDTRPRGSGTAPEAADL